MEKFVGKPHVYSIDINDLSLVESTIKEIVSKKVCNLTYYKIIKGSSPLGACIVISFHRL